MADRLEAELFPSEAEKLERQWSEAGRGRQPTWQRDSRSNVILCVLDPYRSSLGDYLSRGQDSPSRYSPPPCGEDLQDDHTYSTAKSPSRLSSSQVTSPSSPVDDDDIIAVEIQSDVKPEPREIPLDSHVTTAATTTTYISQQPPRGQRRSLGGAGTPAGSSLPWTKSRARGISDTLPLKKRRAATVEKPPESDDEEMKEAAGSLLHLAGVRACLNNITNRTAKGQKEQKEALRN